MEAEEQTEEERGRQTQRTPIAKGRLIIERSRSRDRPKSEAKSEAKTEPKSEPRSKSEPKSVKRELFKDETPKDKKERKRKSPPTKIHVKTEIERINAQTVTKEDIDTLQKTVKKHLEDNPEDAREPKGKRGRPKSAPGASSSSAAASSSQIQIDTTKTKSYWSAKSKQYIIYQMEVRGFDNAKHWPDIQKSTKAELLSMINDLIEQYKW